MLTKDKIQLFEALKAVKGDKLSHLLKFIDPKGIDSVCELVFNTIYTDMNLKNRRKLKVRNVLNDIQSRKNLKIITNKKKNIAKKKKALIQEGKGIGLLLATVAPLIASLFTRKTHQ